jgi:hypothetical protein
MIKVEPETANYRSVLPKSRIEITNIHLRRLIQNIHRQETYCEKIPPRTGPIPPAIAHIISSHPRNRLLLFILKRSLIVMITNWTNPPPAVPCSTRAAISIFILDALAHRIELQKNQATARRRRGLRPHMSLNFDQIGPPAAFAIR